MRAPKISPFRLNESRTVNSMPERASLTGGGCQQARSACRMSAMVLSRPGGAPGSARPDAGSTAPASMVTPNNKPRQQPGRIASPAHSSPQRLLFDGRLLDVVEPGEVLGQVAVALHLHAALVGAAAARRAFAIFGVELVDHLHAGDDAAERREALAIEARIVAEVDEHLAGAGVGARHRVGDVAALVALLNRIVPELRLTPRRRDLRIAVDAELHHKPRDHTEEADVIVEAVLDQIIEAVG